jgi:hypothetical protein
MIKLNVGCGLDYREGFINIDGRDDLPRVDQFINLSKKSLLDFFEEGMIDYVLANDFIEHHFHWQGVSLLKEFFMLLKLGGTLEMRLPDFEYIVNAQDITIGQKITLLFGGQDIPQGEAYPLSRKKFPEFFCHKYAYTSETMSRELEAIGFKVIEIVSTGTNFVVKARKPEVVSTSLK